MLSGVLTAVLETSTQYQDFHSKFEEVFGSDNSDIRVSLNGISDKVKIHLQKQFPDCTDVAFDISAPVFDELLKNFMTKINDGVETTAEEKGDGMQRALMLAVITAYADYRREHDELGKKFVFLIDEAELHLHPTAQRQLKEALRVLASYGDQIFINTHSSVLVVDDFPAQSIYTVKKSSCETAVSKVMGSDKSEIVYELLGGSPSDLLLPQNFLIVEGWTEYDFIRTIVQRFYLDQPQVKIIFAEGDTERQSRSMDAINNAFTPLNQTPVYKDRLVLLCDKPNEDQKNNFDKFVKAYPHLEKNNQLIVLPVSSLEEYYPAPWKKTDVEVVQMLSREKSDLAKLVGQKIIKESFERDMPEIFSALKYAWNKAHQ